MIFYGILEDLLIFFGILITYIRTIIADPRWSTRPKARHTSPKQSNGWSRKRNPSILLRIQSQLRLRRHSRTSRSSCGCCILPCPPEPSQAIQNRPGLTTRRIWQRLEWTVWRCGQYWTNRWRSLVCFSTQLFQQFLKGNLFVNPRVFS